MAKKSKFLPESISGALKNLWGRVFGGLVFILGAWATLALLFYNPYLDGFGVAISFGNQSVMGWIVGTVRYGVGVVPGLFLLMYISNFYVKTN